jgi:hypothetical protein
MLLERALESLRFKHGSPEPCPGGYSLGTVGLRMKPTGLPYQGDADTISPSLRYRLRSHLLFVVVPLQPDKLLRVVHRAFPASRH